jgi:hypothetical protein
MKLKLSILAISLALGACSSTKPTAGIDGGSISAINSQKLSTTFKRKGIKIEWECKYGSSLFGATDAVCVKGDIIAIEASAVATSNGNSENNRETAFNVAEMKAKARLRHFIHEEVSSSTVKNTMIKNIEKANDKIRSRIKTDGEVAISDEEASKDAPGGNEMNYALRENSNNTVRNVTESITTQASGILRGVRTSDESIVDRQTVSVTIRWDRDSEKASDMLMRKFR